MPTIESATAIASISERSLMPAFVGLSSFGARPAEAVRPLAPKDDGTMKAPPHLPLLVRFRGAFFTLLERRAGFFAFSDNVIQVGA